MGTRIIDRFGKPFPTEEIRRRMGFMGGDALRADDSEPPTLGSQPDRESNPRNIGGGTHEEETLHG